MIILPTISVIITTYKRNKKYLERSIRSVINQTFKNFELLIVDDNGDNGYGNNAREVVNSIKSENEIRIISHIKNMGAQEARNTGIKNAKGDYIAFLDDDDEWLERKLELQLQKFLENNDKKLGLVYCGFNKVVTDSNNEKKRVEAFLPSIKNEELKDKIYRRNYIGSTSLPLIKRECFNTIGFFDTKLKAKQDYDMWIRICAKYNIDYVNDILCNYYAHNDERITNNPVNKLDSEITFLNKHYNEISIDNIAISLRLKQIGIYYYATKDFSNANKYLWRSLVKKPTDYKALILFLFALFRVKPNNYIKQKLKVKSQ